MASWISQGCKKGLFVGLFSLVRAVHAVISPKARRVEAKDGQRSEYLES